ncbi:MULTISPECIES: hypothetical protein [Micromonospora]|uniref:Uncharacterized protein n=1 Tax=Micromonospora solifontis TaxID=2487138 RepID=A0ABX9WIJ6_9ACTN|nr:MULTISPECIES: hypothetical protein [Micromonospora]NES12512.1 hypothetical protein [Micromonospora sp. PPF5-17B]NES36043.1 hypothetical protein [Micromonospora solifontis]NES54603.1 hypothetical protein [Micromonospora sp. PPF5-6]RNL99965.1 hypothetical protein EFE23_07660 [Micromonospora solifontis]
MTDHPSTEQSAPDPARPAPAVGVPASRGDLLWEEAAAELVPAKSLARIDERARRAVTAISLVGTLVTGLGLVAGGQVAGSRSAKVLGVAAVVAAVAAVVLALGALLLRLPRHRVALGNLAEVEGWYRREFGRAWGVVAAGCLTMIAVLLAGTASVVALTDRSGDAPTLSLRLTGTGTEAVLTARVGMTGVDPDAVLRTELTGVRADGSRVSLARESALVGPTRTVTVSLTARPVVDYPTLNVEAVTPEWHCKGSLAVANSTAEPVIGCTRR